MKISIVLLIICSVYLQSVNADKPQFAGIIFRHGARGPIYKNLNYDTEFNQFYWEELTPTGQREHFVLGQKLRDRYITGEEHNLGLNEKFDSHEIYVRSTTWNRTINSALSQLNGLYPPGTGPTLPTDLPDYLTVPPFEGIETAQIGNQALPYTFQNLPVHNYPKEQDDLLMPAEPESCPDYAGIQDKYRKSQQASYDQVNDNQKYKDLFAKMTDIFNITETLNFNNIEYYWDTLVADKFNGQIDFPGYDKFNSDDWETLTQLDSLWWFLNNSGSPDGVKVGVSRVIQSWIQYSEIVLGNDVKDPTDPDYVDLTKLKYTMYSCHDDNLVNMMAYLKLSNFECLYSKFNENDGEAQYDDMYDGEECYNRAYYAASVIYELYPAAGNEEAYVRFLFDGEYVQMKMCENTDSTGTKCSYTDYRQSVYDYIYTDPSNPQTSPLQIEELCKINKKTTAQQDLLEVVQFQQSLKDQIEKDNINLDENTLVQQNQDGDEMLTEQQIWQLTCGCLVITLCALLFVFFRKNNQLKQNQDQGRKQVQQYSFQQI